VVRKQLTERFADGRIVVRNEDTPSDYHASNVRTSRVSALPLNL
jgi:hypothetical protein